MDKSKKILERYGNGWSIPTFDGGVAIRDEDMPQLARELLEIMIERSAPKSCLGLHALIYGGHLHKDRLDVRLELGPEDMEKLRQIVALGMKSEAVYKLLQVAEDILPKLDQLLANEKHMLLRTRLKAAIEEVKQVSP